MADLREELLANAKAALLVDSVDVNGEVTTKPANLRAYRHRARGTDKEKLPDASVLYLGEVLAEQGESGTDRSERGVRLGVLCRACATDDQTPDEALIPVLTWVELAVLAADYTLGGVAAEGRLDRVERIATESLADEFAEALMTFEFTVQTKWADPRWAP